MITSLIGSDFFDSLSKNVSALSIAFPQEARQAEEVINGAIQKPCNSKIEAQEVIRSIADGIIKNVPIIYELVKPLLAREWNRLQQPMSSDAQRLLSGIPATSHDNIVEMEIEEGTSKRTREETEEPSLPENGDDDDLFPCSKRQCTRE